MNIEVKNTNNIDYASFLITKNKLNIKLAPNGTGKSSIARAIYLKTTDESQLQSELMPFKYRESNPDNQKTEILGLDDVQNVMCFNEDYVRQFYFKEDELMSNSFDILIRNDRYKEIEQEIEDLVAETKKIFTENQELESLITTLSELGSAFKLTNTGLSKSTTGMKGLSAGNKIEHIPEGLEPYKQFIQGENNVNWIDWQIKGCKFSENTEDCPFCTSNTTEKKEQIKKVGQEYDKNSIKNLLGIIDVIERLGEYFSDEAKSKLAVITGLKDGLEKEHESFIVTIKTQIDDFLDKLEKVKTLSSFQFKEDEKVSDKLPLYKLDLQFFSELNSTKMKDAIFPINASIDTVIQKSGLLQGKINKQRNEIHRLIEQHQQNINDFLTYAGYRYKVEILEDGNQSKLKLLHIDHSVHISKGDQYLSFGERNAFSIVLFMYECLSKNPEIIILDDPISSFDKNKKYAILEMLFRRDSKVCMKNKTVLMLTHDIEPIIDTVKSLSQKFGNLSTASFLKLRSGQITEHSISKDDITTFSSICTSALNSAKDEVVKLIYLRRHYEILDEKGNAYQVLSNLLHKRETTEDSRQPRNEEEKYPEMSEESFSSGCQVIEDSITGFSYTEILGRLLENGEMKSIYNECNNGYEKLQLFRLFEITDVNSVIQKFINETYHIENEFICQLDPAQFDTIPEYVTLECDRMVAAV